MMVTFRVCDGVVVIVPIAISPPATTMRSDSSVSVPVTDIWPGEAMIDVCAERARTCVASPRIFSTEMIPPFRVAGTTQFFEAIGVVPKVLGAFTGVEEHGVASVKIAS